jgi:hypothetical protein
VVCTTQTESVRDAVALEVTPPDGASDTVRLSLSEHAITTVSIVTIAMWQGVLWVRGWNPS